MTKINLLLVLGLCSLTAYSQDLSTIKNEKPFAISGRIDARTIMYSSSGIDGRRSPFTYILSGAPTLSFYGITVPITFTISEQERNFSQPFNQIGLSPTYKWLTLHGGYRNVRFSPYTLAGHTVLGGGAELRPGKWEIGFMTGRLNRSTSIDTLSGYLTPESFSRYGSAVKVGYGERGKKVGISFLSAKDSDKGFKGNLDSTQVKKASNAVLGADFEYTFFKKLLIFGDGAVSVYTKDIHSDLEVDIDSSRKGLNQIKDLFNLNATSEYYLAYSGGIGYIDKIFSLKAAYKLVEPNFQSMGAYYFQNDLRNITISPSLNLLKGKLRLNGSIGIQEDNQKKKKLASTKRVISLANVSWDLSNSFGFDANFTNFSSNSEPTVALVDQKYLLAQTNQNLSLTPRLVLNDKQKTQVFILSYNASSLKDLNEESSHDNDIFTNIAYLNYNLILNQSNLSVNVGLNYVNNKMSIGNIANKGISLGVSKGLLKNKLNLSSQNSYTLSELTNGNASIINLGVNAAYLPVKNHQFSLRFASLMNNTSLEDLDPLKYQEFTGEIGYTFSF
ncbi:hypothetical protein Lbys_0682 [Leadbetterella byssophila DSM 17132]|uniref:DUF5723 domain-containing protein n=1 Tax=Leadbetterella byssophila (strain DSM 17132 / JCM 16389 / KACC 11308 / NBRC 106382 / 4M15) TaxID=649349 RepID=E4RZA5_LEAB4|nr:hypothetical protein [Leadbetterella byssophila]ADQ16444.1 hypothetical protein Lbys_0682 [Leadbetterella byssophila DSM 17132]